ncbi:MAG: PadR family transcriptional regulator [Acidimicrobiia bacterium]
MEVSILAAGLEAGRAGEREFHGYSIARAIQELDSARRLTAHGTLYKALGRLEEAGLLKSRWEAAEIAEAEHRPRRRLYRVTGAGASALARSMATAPPAQNDLRPALATS